MTKPLTRNQKKWVSYLQAEKARQANSLAEHSQYPEFRLWCSCFTELKTSSVTAALNFIERDHRGHKMTMEINQKPNATKYDRQVVLDQLVELGKAVVKDCAKDGVVVNQTRATWLTISNGIYIEDALKRLLAVYEHKDNYDQCLANRLFREWLTAIVNQDLRLLAHIRNLLEKENG